MLKNMFKVTTLLVLLLSGIWFFNARKNDNSSKPLWGFSVEGFPISKVDLDKLEQETAMKAQIIQFYLQWPSQDSEEFLSITSTLNAISDRNALPSMTWEPMIISENRETAIPYQHILNGNYDAYLGFIADEIKKWHKPLIIRFAQEMNLERYHWGTIKEQFNDQSPKIYIHLFRYLVMFFRNRGVQNVLWAFCPNVDSIPNTTWNQPKNYYPGDGYVDILGMDGYNWAITPEIAQEKQLTWARPWQSFEQLFYKLHQELQDIAPGLPIAVFETSTANREGEDKQVWLKEAIKTAQEWNLWGVIWFQINKEEDWRIYQPLETGIKSTFEVTSL